MMRGNGFRVNSAAHSYGDPTEYITPTTQALPINSVLVQGSTMGGEVGLAATTNVPDFIGLRATTGGQTIDIPCIRVLPTVEFVVPLATSETVISTTNEGNHVSFATSGTAIVASATGTFVIRKVYNTSGADAQYFTGHFTPVAVTTK